MSLKKVQLFLKHDILRIVSSKGLGQSINITSQKKSIVEIQRVLAYFPALDGYAFNWRDYFKEVDAEVDKM